MKQFLLILLTSISFSSFAQSNSKASKTEKFKIGVLFSPNHSNYKIEKNNEYEERGAFGFSAGITGHYSLAKQINIRLGALYALKRNEVHYDNDIYTFNYQYLDIPLTVHADFMAIYFFGLRVFGGVSTNIYLGNNIKVEQGDQSTETPIGAPSADSFNPFTFSGIVGIEAHCNLTHQLAISIEPTFVHDFTPTYKHSSSNSYYDNKQYHYSFGVNIGVVYAL